MSLLTSSPALLRPPGNSRLRSMMIGWRWGWLLVVSCCWASCSSCARISSSGTAITVLSSTSGVKGLSPVSIVHPLCRVLLRGHEIFVVLYNLFVPPACTLLAHFYFPWLVHRDRCYRNCCAVT